MDKRYDFVFMFDVQDGNPNGDPDSGNLPRVDPESGHGLVTDVCLKRKIRNFVSLVKGEKSPFDIYIKSKSILNQTNLQAYEALGKKPRGKKEEADVEAVDWMCENFYDVRTFGAVMSTGVNCGQVRGPVQLTFSRSIDPIFTVDHSVSRCAVTTEEEAKEQGGANRTLGRKATIPYALYKCYGFINPHLAKRTGFSDDDLQLLWTSLSQMFETDRSASRGLMNAQKLVVFEHKSALGNAPSQKLFDRVCISKKDPDSIVRSIGDYQIEINKTELPKGITIHDLI